MKAEVSKKSQKCTVINPGHFKVPYCNIAKNEVKLTKYHYTKISSKYLNNLINKYNTGRNIWKNRNMKTKQYFFIL